jgi:hypothetical protein
VLWADNDVLAEHAISKVQPRRWKQHISPKHQYMSTDLCNVITWEATIRDVKTSELLQMFLDPEDNLFHEQFVNQK